MSVDSAGNEGAMPATKTTLSIVVAGHTNTGKTSLLRTLGRTTAFGLVSPRPSLTRQVQALELIDTGSVKILFYDTPGLERSARLRERLEQRLSGAQDQRALVQQFLASAEAASGYEQEARVLAQVLSCDAALYVVDAREPVLPKYLDELYLLALCGRPIIPVLNFTAWPQSQLSQWREKLANNGHHIIVPFDAVAYSWEAERQLFKDLQRVLPSAVQAFDVLLKTREQQAQLREQQALKRVAEALVDVAAAEELVPVNQVPELCAAIARVQAYARAAEQALSVQLFKVFNYEPDLLRAFAPLDLDDRGWERDLFAADSLGYYGVKAFAPAAAFAAMGFGIDAALGGASLGLATASGMAIGLVTGSRTAIRNAWRKRVTQQVTVAVDDNVLLLLATRSMALLEALSVRGHASQVAMTNSLPQRPAVFSGRFPGALRNARDKPQWSGYRSEQSKAGQMVDGIGQTIDEALSFGLSAGRQQSVDALAERLHAWLRPDLAEQRRPRGLLGKLISRLGS